MISRPFWAISTLVASSIQAFVSVARAASSTAVCQTSIMSAVENSQAYKTLLTKLDTITQLQRVSSVLGYDQLVFMPQEASADRGAQKSALASLIHEKTTDKELKELIELASKELEGSNDKDAKRLLELERKSFEENERIPKELAAKAASLSSSAYAAWVEAKTTNDFASFAPVLKDCFDTTMELADAKRGDKEISLYTQMLDQFETGMSQTRIDEIFGEIQAALVPLIKKVLESEEKPSIDPLKGNFDIETQQALCEEIVTKLGYDKSRGRIDVSVHPMTTSFSPKDVRITSRYRDTEWYQGLAAMIHESGHAIYEQNLGDSATSVDSALSMGTHESQSLFWERHIGLSLPFWKWATPILKQHFPDHFSNLSPLQIYQAVNAVSPGLIRVEADELTYPLHVIMRYKIEKEVIGGSLSVEDIPGRWNSDMKSMLDVDVPDDAKGCLQDIHWASLAFGYFPTYLIGSATAAQLAHYCQKNLDMDDLVEKGEFEDIKSWLTDKIHRHGKRYESLDDLLQEQIGEKLNAKYFIEYLTEKYSGIYKI
jgi:carboxypeptidase Taq